MMQAVRPWAVALGPPVAWVFHLVATYGVEEVVCSLRVDQVRIAPAVVLIGIVAATVVALAATLAATVSGYRLWRAQGRDSGARAPAGRDAFLGMSGSLLGALFVAVILLQAAPVLFLPPCA